MELRRSNVQELKIILVLIALVLRIFSNSLSNVYQKQLTLKGCNPYTINAVTYISLSLICLPFLKISGIAPVQSGFLYYSVIVGVLGALGNTFLIKALDGGELSVLAPINSYKAVVGLLFAMIFLGEFPSLIAILGIAFVILGSYFVLDTTKERFSLELLKNKNIQYRILALVFCAAEAVFIKKVILLSTPWLAFVSWCYFGAIFSVVLLMIKRVKLEKSHLIIKSRNLIHYVNIVVCVGIMQFTTNYLFNKMNVAYALSLFQLSAMVSVVFGYKFFQEKHIRKKLMGAAIMIVGAVLIIVYN